MVEYDWYGMVVCLVLVHRQYHWYGIRDCGMAKKLWNGIRWPFHHTMEWYRSDIPCWNGYPLGTLNQGIDVPHRYPKMGD